MINPSKQLGNNTKEIITLSSYQKYIYIFFCYYLQIFIKEIRKPSEIFFGCLRGIA